MKPRFRITQNAQTRTVQEDVRAFAEQVGEIAKGALLKNVAIAAAATTIAHGQSGTPAGWLVGSLSADARVWQTAAPDEKFLYLQASAAVTCNLWVY
jgi:hypothetical protein